MSRSSRRRAAAPAFPALPDGVQVGLKRLVSDNEKTVAEMLNADDDTDVDALCEKCAVVMKQQQLSASSFLARFFHEGVLSSHAVQCLEKSGKGSAPVLAERIAGEWAKNTLTGEEEEDDDGVSSGRKRKKDSSESAVEKKKKATKKMKFVFEAWLSDDVEERSEHKTSVEAAKAAWEFCDDNMLQMPSADWTTETRYGSQECFNVMVPAGDWEPETAFVKYMSKHAQKGDVRLTNGNKFIAITKEV